MKARVVITALLRRARPRAAVVNPALQSYDVETDQAASYLAAWAAATDPAERAEALVAAATCRQRQAAVTAAAFGGVVHPDALPGLAEESRLCAVLLRLVALTENEDLVKPGPGGTPTLDPEALEHALVTAEWLDYDDSEANLAEAVEPHLFDLATLRWDPTAGPRSRRYAAELSALARTVSAWNSISTAAGVAGGLARRATAWADRP